MPAHPLSTIVNNIIIINIIIIIHITIIHIITIIIIIIIIAAILIIIIIMSGLRRCRDQPWRRVAGSEGDARGDCQEFQERVK